MARAPYVPETGHLIKIDFDPRAGHKQSWLAASDRVIARQLQPPDRARYRCSDHEPAEGIPLRDCLARRVLSDAIKNLDWRARNARYIEEAPPAVLASVREQLGLLLGFQNT